MICRITVRLGVYLLGAADAAERALVESHLTACPACRAELTRLEPLPKLLAQLPVDLLEAEPALCGPPGRPQAARITQSGAIRAGMARAAAGRWRAVACGAAAAVAGIAAGLWLAPQGAIRPATSAPSAAITLSAANPVTHVRVRATLTGTSWGTSIRLLVRGLPQNHLCRLIVRSRSGATEVAGDWDAWRSGPVYVPASAGLRLADISSLQVAIPGKSLVTIAMPPAASSRHPRAGTD
jgi:Putative zinc-finger